MMVRLPSFVDERFLMHRRQSTSIAGIVATVVAIVLWVYRIYHDHMVDWNLLSIAVTFVVVKYAAFAWYRTRN